ncbi:TPA: YPDG domain-containing protein, partial [Streptococcus suis]|nr:YPDG domain-containing protein [Streptococcus suis]
MSNRDKNMFRQEQRFSFRKYSFGLASALIANVVFGATIAGGPVAHADTETEVAAVTSSSSQQLEVEITDASTSIPTENVAAPVERQVVLTYTVQVVDNAGTVLKTEEKTVEVKAGENLVSIIAELGEDLVPADYKLVDGLGQVRIVENQENIFTVTVEKVVTEPVVETVSETSKSEASATVESSEVTNVSSETVSKASSEAVKNLNSETKTVSSSEAPVENSAMSETAVAPAPVKVTEAVSSNTNSLSAFALLAYEVRYTDSEGEVVHKTAGLVTAESKDGAATKEVSFSASDIPAGYELAEGQSSVLTKVLVENQINILSFAVVKKSKEEEIAESQLANKTVLEQVLSEGHLLAKDATRLLETSQAGNARLEAATKNTNKVLAGANLVFDEPTSNQEQVDEQVELVKAASKALADELLKLDDDGILTSQLSWTQTDETSYQVANNDGNLAKVSENVRITERTVTGQHVHLVVEYNWSQKEGGRNRPYLDFALPKDVVDSSVRVALQHRADSASSWINQWQMRQGNINDYTNGQKNLSELASTSGARLMYDLSVTDATAGQPGLRAKFVDSYYTNTAPKNDALAGKMRYYFENQMGNTSEIFRYVIDYDIKDGVNPNDTPFFAELEDSQGSSYSIYESKLVDNQPTQASGKQEIFVFQDTPIKTVNAGTAVPNGVDKVKIGTITDADVIQSITMTDGDPLGYSVDTDGNAYGTPNGPQGLGSYKRALNVTDKKGNTTEVFSRASGSDDRYVTYILSATADSNAIVFNNGHSADARKQAVLNKVNVGSGTASSVIEAGDKKYKKYIVNPDTGQEAPLPTTPGDHTVTVRVVTASNVYKDVQVKITNPVNHAPVITTSATNTQNAAGENITVQTDTPKAIYIFSKTVENTESASGEKTFTPVANKDLENPIVPIRKLAEMSDPDAGDTITHKYNDLRNDQTHLSQTNLVMTNDGYLSGNYTDWGPGAKSTRRIDVTDNHGATTSSEPFLVLGYTIKADSSALEVVGSPTLDQITSKLVLDVNSAYPTAVPSEMVVPTDQYGHQIVGYRTAEGQETTAVTSADQLPDGGTYQVKVRTTNIYGQEIFNWVNVNSRRNNPPVITTSATDTNVTVQAGTPKAIHIFSKTVGDTEDANGNKLFTPVASKDLENPLVPIQKLAEFSDPDAGDTVTYKYNDLRNDQTHLSQTDLVMTNEGYLSGNYTDWGPGAKSTRRIDVTDNHGATTSSDPFLVLGYTIKVTDTTPVEVVGRPTIDQVKQRLVLDVNSAYPSAVPSEMTVPSDQYAHAIVGYRTAAGQPTQTGELPASGNYQVKVRTTNIYGQEIFNWVNVNSTPENTPTTATDKKHLYIFTNTAIKTVDAGTNVDSSTTDDKVKVANLQDPEGIKSVVISRESDTSAGSFSPAPIGITIDTQGNASGTTDKGVGVYSRGLTVTDNNDVVTNLFPRNNEIETYVLDATAGTTITKAVGETVTEAEILNNVTVSTGNGNTLDPAINTRYRKVLAPNQTVPTTPGEHTVTVRVITDSNVYKDVPVTVVIPNPPATATNKQDIYVFKNSPIQTVNPTTNEEDNANKVKIADLSDPQGIKQVEVKQIGSALGYTVDTEGNATGTVADVGVGAYSRELAVTDKLDAQTTVLVNGNPDQRFKTYVMDVTTDTTPVAFALGDTLESRTADILSKVSISSGDESAHIEGTTDNNPKYTKVIAPGQTLPTTPGEHKIKVRVVTESNVFKDVEVPITIPANTAPTVRQDIPNQYVWKGTAVEPAINANVQDVNSTPERDDISQVYFSSTASTADLGNPGAVSITKDADGNYMIGGTPVGEAGYTWNRKITAVDKQNATGQSNAFSINILDSRVKAEINKPANAEVTEAEVLEQVEVLSRTVETNQTHDITTQLANDGGVTKRVLTDLSTMPKTGRQTVQVELTTPSGHKKIEEVIVNFAAPETDNATPAYAEKTVVPGTPSTSTPTFTDANGQSITAPAGATYEIPADFQAPAGYTAEIDPNTGVVTVTAADGTTVESIEVPVKVTYADGSEDDTTAVFKLDTDGDGTPDTTDTDDDNDNVPDVDENTDNTNPKNPDTDGDGITDGAEKTDGTDPN